MHPEHQQRTRVPTWVWAFACALIVALALVAGAIGASRDAKAEGVDKRGPTVDPAEEVVAAVKKFKPYISVYAGAAALYTDGKVGGFLDDSDGGFDAAALGGGGLGFTSRIGESAWFWGLEANAERRMTTSDSTPLSQYFKGGELKYTAAVDGMLGVHLSTNTKFYGKAGYRWGWSEDMVGTVSGVSFSVPTKSGPEAGLGLSHNLNKNWVLDLNVMAWFLNGETASGTPLSGPIKLDGSDITGRAGLKFEF